MGYKIETISVYEVFEQKGGCPFCRLEKRLEKEYIEYYLGSAAMTPEIRIKVNRSGFAQSIWTGCIMRETACRWRWN